ncbi:MAG TPA: hypothetical protein DCE56_29420 [Cyanobacteria bacterium UBA8553]|nr:hypothetical protein [Cyanobacteria bacterium UBA8553]
MGVQVVPFYDEFKIDRQIIATSAPTVLLANNPSDVEQRRKYSFLECNTRAILSKLILKVEIKPNSLPEINLPNYTIEDTEAEQLAKTLQLQWKSPRYQGVIWANESLTSELSWARGDFFSILNNSGVPYVNYNILNMLTTDIFEGLGKQGRLGISFEDVGWGLPKNTDILTLKGTWAQQGNCVVNEDPPLLLTGATVQQVVGYGFEQNRLVGTVATQILAARVGRKSGSIRNGSTANTVSYSYTQNFAVTEGTIPANGTINLPTGNTGEVWARASAAGTSVTGSETYNVVL